MPVCDEIADVCIVGAGPAGLTLADRLAGRGMRVLVVEAGGAEQSAASQDFYAGEVVDPAVHWPLDSYRLRALGGTSKIWGGRCIPYDAIDFELRAWVPHSGWPIGFGDLAHFYPAALAAAEGGRFEYAPSGEIVPGLDGEWLATTVERFSRPTDFWVRFKDRLARSGVAVMAGSAVTGVRLNRAGTSVDHLELRPMGRGGDDVARLRARFYVLAAGGLEVTRLLLASNDVLPNGIGNQGGWLGRGYMCHLAATFGEVEFSGPPRSIGFDYQRDDEGIYLRRRLALTEKAQRELGVMNFTARLHIPDANDPAHRNAVLSLIFLAAYAVKFEYSRAMREADRSWGVLARHWGNILRDPVALWRFATGWGVARFLSSRRIPSIALFAKNGRYPLEFHAEQAPNYESTVSLGAGRDAYGMPRLRVDWRAADLDFATIRKSYQLIARELERTGTGRLTFDDAGLEAAVLKAGAYGGHHSGTTRMAARAADGVVDSDCRVFGVDNLFVASGSVLPTSSQANPTLTTLALALRLGDHLQGLARQGAEASEKPVLVTGAAGFVGRAVVRHLAEAGFVVRAGTRGGVEVAGGQSCVCDVLDAASVAAAMKGVGAVVHCAVGADAGEMARAMGHVLAAARASGAHVVQMSSVAVYGDVSGVVDEAAPCAKPAGAYGRTKLAAEGLCRVAATQGLPVTILRPSLIWGEGSAQWTLPYVARMHSGGWHALGAQGEGRANLIHVEDLAGFVAHILRAPRPRDLAVYNVNGADLPSWNGYLAALRDGLGLPPFLPERRWLGLAVLGRQMFRMADKIATRSLWRDGVPRFWWGWRRKAFNTPSRDEAQRFGAQVAYDITRMRQAGFAPQVDLASGIARLAAAKAPQRTECSTRPSTQEKSMKQAVEVAAALAIALFAARGDDVRAQAAAKAGQCIERANEDEMSSRIEDRGVSAWVSVRKPAQASVTASMEGVGSKLGLLRLSLMRDGQRLAPMQEETGSGRLEVRLRASIMLEPGHQYRIYAKPEGRDKAVKAVRLKISVDGGCG